MSQRARALFLCCSLAACGGAAPEALPTGSQQQPFSLSPLRIANPRPASEDYFAPADRSLSFDPSGDRLAVGVPGADASGLRDSGVVYLIRPSSGAVLAVLTNPEPAEGASFGSALTFHDGGLAVGASGADRGFGKVYLFDSAGALRRTFDNPNRGAPVAPPFNNDLFGADLLSLGGGRLLVGAPFTDCPAANADGGAVYVLDTACSTSPVQRRIDSPVCPGGFSWFGMGLARGAAGRVIIGAPVDGTSAKHGAVYVYNSGDFTMLRKLNNPEPGTYDYFGSVNAEIAGRLYVAAPTDDLPGVSGTDHGRVFVYDAESGAPAGELRDPAPAGFDHFGSSLAGIGEQVLVGSSAWHKVSAVQVFQRDGALAHTIHNPAGVTTFFGQALKAQGDTLVVAAPNESYGAARYAGALYRY